MRAKIRFNLSAQETEIFQKFVRAIAVGEFETAAKEKRKARVVSHDSVAKQALLWAMQESHRRAEAAMAHAKQQAEGVSNVSTDSEPSTQG